MSVTEEPVLGDEWAFADPSQPFDDLEEDEDEDARDGIGLLAVGTVWMIAILFLAAVAFVQITT